MNKMIKIMMVALSFAVLTSFGANAQNLKFFTIGTGGTAYTYYPVGGMIANAISRPPGSRPCDAGGSCGVENLIASAVSSRGSVDNLNAISSKLRSSGFAQADVTYWAYTGTGTMEGQKPMKKLRAIAALYPEHIHLVARRGAKIKTVADLKGKRVSLDEPGSGTYVDANLILDAYGIKLSQIKVENLKGGAAADALRNGKIDAFFVVAGYPAGTIAELASSTKISLVPLADANAKKLIKQYSFFSLSDIPSGIYKRVGKTSTLAVGAQWITSTNESEKLVYDITKALWNKNSRILFDKGHAKGKVVTIESALDGIGIPLHKGAAKFYREAGILK